MTDFKNLFIDASLFKSEILKFAEMHDCEINGPTEKPKFHEYTIIKTGQNKALLHVYYLASGLITFNYKVGQNVELSKSLANHLASKCLKTKFVQKPLSLNSLSVKDWEFLIEYLSSAYQFIVKPETVPHGVRYQVSGQKLQPVYLTRYNTGKFLMQGKALEIYGIVASLLCELVQDKNEVIAAQLSAYSLDDITLQSLDEELGHMMPASYKFIGETLRAIISPSLAFVKLNVDLPDYSGFVYPVLRGLEGYVKLLLLRHGYSTEYAGFDDKFVKGALKSGVKAKINCADTVYAIETSFDLYTKHRHGLFHVDANPETSRLIETKEEAVTLIYEVLGLIERTYLAIP